MFQKTVKSEVFFNGAGLHSGKNINVKVSPADEDTGICFLRKDMPSVPLFRADASSVVNTERCTVIGNEYFTISTIEHLFSALYALEITNVLIEVDSSELPALDGSALPFYLALKDAGIVEQRNAAKVLNLKEPVFLSSNNCYLIALPSNELRFTVLTDYPEKSIGRELCDFVMSADAFEKSVAPARTFAFYSEVKALLEKNLALGGSIENALVIYDDAYSSPLRLNNEIAAHKCLDLIGDISLCSYRLKAHITAIKPGHKINTAFALMLQNIGGNH